MAYKFQLGAARLGGSITADGTLSGTAADFNDGNVTNVGDIALASLSKDGSGEIEVTDAIRMSGTNAIEFTNNNVKIVNQAGSSLELHAGGNRNLEIHAGKVEALTNLEMSGASELHLRGSNQRIYSQGNDQLAIDVAGSEILNINNSRIQVQNKLQMSGSQIFQVRETIIESLADNQFKINNPESNGELQFEISGTRRATLSSTGIVINNEMSASTISLDDATGIAGTSLENSAGTLRLATSAAGNGLTGGGASALSVERSGSDADAGIQVTADGLRIHTNIAGNKIFDDNVTVAGNLTVQGTTTTIDSTTLTVADINIVVGQGGSGSLDNLGLTFGSAGGVQTLQTKDSSGTQKLGSSLPLSASSYYGDGSNLTGITAEASGYTYNTYLSGTATQSLAGKTGVHVINASNGNATTAITLQLSGTWTDGDAVLIKAPGNANSQNLTIAASGTNLIDGQSSIVLESSNGAVQLIRAADSMWLIF